MKRCVLEEVKEKGTSQTPENTMHRKKSFTSGSVKSTKGPISLWNFLSQPISAGSRVNKPPWVIHYAPFGISLLLIDSSQLDVCRLSAKCCNCNRRLGPNGWLHVLFPLILPSSLFCLYWNYCPMKKRAKSYTGWFGLKWGHHIQTIPLQLMQQMLDFKGMVLHLLFHLCQN